MAVLKIALMGNEILKRTAEPVEEPTAPEIAELVSHMEDTLIDTAANGIAAPQVFVSKAVVLYRIAANKIPRGSLLEPIPLRILINPTVTPLTDERLPFVERCLSLPGLYGTVPRHARISVDAVGTDGAPIEIEASGYHAALLQHECDHLRGVLYPMRMTDMATLGFTSESGAAFFLAK